MPQGAEFGKHFLLAIPFSVKAKDRQTSKRGSADQFIRRSTAFAVKLRFIKRPSILAAQALCRSNQNTKILLRHMAREIV